MRLEPKAKPVNIRITSGASEHDSLDSLRSDFMVSDIAKMLDDGRLRRWLETQGESSLSKIVASMNGNLIKSMEGVLYLCGVFFPEVGQAETPITLLTLTDYWWCYGYKLNVINILSIDRQILKEEIASIKTIVNRYGNIYQSFCQTEKEAAIHFYGLLAFLADSGVEDLSIQKQAAELYFEFHPDDPIDGEKATEEAIKHFAVMEKLAKEGDDSAKIFIEEKTALDYEKVKDWFNEIWSSKAMTIKYPSNFTKQEIQVAEFIDKFHQINIYRRSYFAGARKLYNELYPNITKGEPFYNEVRFLGILLKSQNIDFRYKSERKKIDDMLMELNDYKPAMVLLKPDEDPMLYKKFIQQEYPHHIKENTMIRNIILNYFEEHL